MGDHPHGDSVRAVIFYPVVSSDGCNGLCTQISAVPEKSSSTITSARSKNQIVHMKRPSETIVGFGLDHRDQLTFRIPTLMINPEPTSRHPGPSPPCSMLI